MVLDSVESSGASLVAVTVSETSPQLHGEVDTRLLVNLKFKRGHRRGAEARVRYRNGISAWLKRGYRVIARVRRASYVLCIAIDIRNDYLRIRKAPRHSHQKQCR